MRPFPTVLLAFVLLCSGSSMAEFLGRRFQWAGLVHVIRSGVISQPPGVLRGKCACSYLPLRSARRRPGAACCSIVYRPLAAEVLVAERTLTPADRTAGPEKATETSQANVRTDASMQGPSLTSAASTAPLGPVWRAPIKRAQAVVPTAPRYGSYAAGYQPWYSARQRGSYGLQSKYGSYTNRQYQ